MIAMMVNRISCGHCALPAPLRGRHERNSVLRPGVIGFYLALLPNLIDLRRVDLFGYAELGGLCVAVLTVVLGAYALAAARARALFTSPRAVRLFNRTGGTLMAGAAIAVASK